MSRPTANMSGPTAKERGMTVGTTDGTEAGSPATAAEIRQQPQLWQLVAKAHSERADSLVLFMPAAANDRGFAMTSSFTSMLLAAQLTLDPDSSSGRYVERLGAAANRLLAERTDQLARLAARRYRRVVY